jgi:predicted nucleic-acid-binding Zn-ribbon protein
MNLSGICPKCKGNELVLMNFQSSVALDFPTFHLGDKVIPKLHICLTCGYSEIWIDGQKDLNDISKFVSVRKKKGRSSKASD